jgi:hypothetical protein
MKQLIATALIVASSGLVGLTRADDTKADPSGTWKWTVTHGEQTREVSVTLKLEGDQLGGMMFGRNGQEMKVENGLFKNGRVSFTVAGQTPDGQPMIHRFSGTLVGDTIKGTVEIERGGQTHNGKWEAKRSKD